MAQHYVDDGWGDPEYKCWERDHPHGGRCGGYKLPEKPSPARDLWDHLLKD